MCVVVSSDADSDVLADYVLALLRHEQGEAEVKKLCVDQLDDFLREREFFQSCGGGDGGGLIFFYRYGGIRR